MRTYISFVSPRVFLLKQEDFFCGYIASSKHEEVQKEKSPLLLL